MTEFQQVDLFMWKILIVLLYAWATANGGRSQPRWGIRARIWKRWIAPLGFSTLLLGTFLFMHKFSFWFLLFPLVLTAQTSIFGYGGDTLWWKILRRSMWSLSRSVCALSFCVLSGAWFLFGLQLVLGLVITVLLGVWNPVKDAPSEEGLINFESVILMPFMV